MSAPRRWLCFVLLFGAVCLVPASAAAQSERLAWDASDRATGYIVRWGLTQGTYPNSADAGNVTQFVIAGLTPGVTYWTVVQAYDEFGQVSANSVPLQFMAAAPAPTDPIDPVITARENARADFDGDGNNDLIWQNLLTGNVESWSLSGQNVLRRVAMSHRVADLNWRIAGTGDFNGDGRPDIVWHHQGDGSVYLWYMNGLDRTSATYFSRPNVAIGWKLMGVGDFNGDTRPDIVWQNEAEGRIAFWMLDGTTVTSVTEMPIRFLDTRWHVTGVGDFNRDGQTDLLLRHSGYGEIGIWIMNGTTRVSYRPLTPGAIADPAWRVAAVIDANGDNHLDLVWHHVDHGGLAVWYMNVTTRFANPSFTTSSPPSWRLMGPK